MALITLLTDFGLNDEFVGVMKGVILAINPQARIVDITHGIAPQDLVSAAYRAQAAYRYFPQGTVHVVVVDPGVGSSRAIVAVQQEGHVFLAPDNGVLSLVIDAHKIEGVVRVTNDQFFLKPVSCTFHGRDIFAPVGAYLASGVPLEEFGSPMERINRITIPKPQSVEENLVGEVISIDHFGNLISSIRRSDIDLIGPGEVYIEDEYIGRVYSNFDDKEYGDLIAVFSSIDYLLIAVNNGSAVDRLKVSVGAKVRYKAVSE